MWSLFEIGLVNLKMKMWKINNDVDVYVEI